MVRRMRGAFLACCVAFAAQAPAPVQVPPGKPPPLPSDQTVAGRSGTGFVVAPGKLLTSHHVVAPCHIVAARNPAGRRLTLRAEAADPARDLALLAIDPAAGPPLAFRAEPVIRGEAVATYGYPDSGPALIAGTVTALSGLHGDPVQLQISASVQPGSSGSPLFDGQGRVIGVIVATLDTLKRAGAAPPSASFAVKGTEALEFLHAHGVTPPEAADHPPTAIDAIANPSTFPLQCLR